MRKFIMLVVVSVIVLASVLGGWWFATPWLAMKGLADAAAARDTAQLEQRIDFAALRENARSELGNAIGATGNRLVDRIGGAVLGNIADGAIDLALTPDGMARMIESGALVAGLLPERLRGQDISWNVERQGLDSFRGVGTFEDGTPAPVLVFERRGMGWQMTGVELRRQR